MVVVEGNLSVLLWSKLDFCPCTRNWTKLNNKIRFSFSKDKHPIKTVLEDKIDLSDKLGNEYSVTGVCSALTDSL